MNLRAGRAAEGAHPRPGTLNRDVRRGGHAFLEEIQNGGYSEDHNPPRFQRRELPAGTRRVWWRCAVLVTKGEGRSPLP